jgi:pimeloyl-ACP methyl ester carboxylesterase
MLRSGLILIKPWRHVGRLSITQNRTVSVSLNGSQLPDADFLRDDLYCETEKYFDYRSRLQDIHAPTLIVVGEEDWICPICEELTVNHAG